MKFVEDRDMNCWVKLILYLDIHASTELRLYFSNRHVYNPAMYQLRRAFKIIQKFCMSICLHFYFLFLLS